MPPDEESIADLGADPQILSRVARTLTPPHVTPTAGEAIALQLASTGTTPETDAQPLGLHIGYTAVAPLMTASFFRHVRDQCGEVVAVRGCEAATRAHLVGTSDPDQRGPLIDPTVRLTICDAIAHANVDLRATLVRAIMSNEVACGTDTTYTTHPLASVVAVGQTLAAADEEPFDPQIAACLDCLVPLQLAGDGSAASAQETSTADVAPVPSSRLGAYLEAVWSTEPTPTAEARTQWEEYTTDQPPDAWPAWTRVGSTSPAETVPKLAAALARLHLTEAITVAHTTRAIEWFETSTSHPAVTDHAV